MRTAVTVIIAAIVTYALTMFMETGFPTAGGAYPIGGGYPSPALYLPAIFGGGDAVPTATPSPTPTPTVTPTPASPYPAPHI